VLPLKIKLAKSLEQAPPSVAPLLQYKLPVNSARRSQHACSPRHDKVFTPFKKLFLQALPPLQQTSLVQVPEAKLNLLS
jgi:hypothetical protein